MRRLIVLWLILVIATASNLVVAQKISNTAYLVTSENFPDALVVGVLAAKTNSLVFVTPSGTLDKDVLDLLTNLSITNVVIVGEKQAISFAVEQTLKNKGFSVTRVGGVDRQETSAKLASLDSFASTIILVEGGDYPDLCAATALAIVKDAKILLIYKDRLGNATIDLIKKFKERAPPKVYIVGGPEAISANLDKQIEQLVYSPPIRISGKDAFETSYAIAKEAATAYINKAIRAQHAFLVPIADFTQSLNIVSYAKIKQALILPSDRDSLRPDTEAALKSLNITLVTEIGDFDTKVETSISKTGAKVELIREIGLIDASLKLQRKILSDYYQIRISIDDAITFTKAHPVYEGKAITGVRSVKLFYHEETPCWRVIGTLETEQGTTKGFEILVYTSVGTIVRAQEIYNW
ncbi:MAG: cell wall-binding repeat-containing protein [Euryarchaeota archaeon]|nr:cell wall-binding repeat-containing protein [Euryarchaeota archaeon]